MRQTGRDNAGMKQRGSPLWLVCDILCWIGASIALPAFTRALQRIVRAVRQDGRRNLHPRELSLVAHLLAEAEAWLMFAITRRAFHIAGLKRSRVRFPQLSQAATLGAFKARARQLTFTFNTLDSRAKAMARRLRLLTSEQSGATTTRKQQNNSNRKAAALTPRAVVSRTERLAHSSAERATPAGATTTTKTRAGLRVRAPPWRPYSLFPAPYYLCGASYRDRTRMSYARKSPLAPPDLASRRTPSIRIARSTALSMS
jgi:hypothetical protein